MDARMQEVYWAEFHCEANGLVSLVNTERLSAPGAVSSSQVDVIAGTALSAYPELASRFPTARHVSALPRARDILLLGEREFREGCGQSAAEAQPVYLRDQVTFVKAG
jgi:tRNA threonylcarbamoyladenosine biosynthesis protein TsaB